MYYDALTLTAMRDELAELLMHGRVQKVVQPAPLVVGLEVYAGRRYPLLLSAEPQAPGVYLMESVQRRGTETPSPLFLLLAKYARGARITAIEQPPLERVLSFALEGEHGPVRLLCEIMGRYSNVILVDRDGLVMDAIKRIPPSLNRYRSTLPHQPYVPPPPQHKDDPHLLTEERLNTLAAQSPEKPLWQMLVARVTGVSPLVAREVAFRATGSLEPSLPLMPGQSERLLQALGELMDLPRSHAWAPSVAFDGQGVLRGPMTYAPYELTHLPDHQPFARISDAILRVWEARQSLDAYRQVRLRLHALIQEQMVRQRARLASLRRALVPSEQTESLRERADAILALAWSIQPGQNELVADPEALGKGGDGQQGALRIALDPALSPSENAEKLYREYRKQQAAARAVPALIQRAELDLRYLGQLASDVDLAENRPQLDAVESELHQAGWAPGRRAPKVAAKLAPLSVRAADGTLILVGRNSRENEAITFDRAAADDLWLHAHGVPGAHVVIKCGGAAVGETVLLQAARLAAHYSAARREARVHVDMVLRRHVRRVPGGRPGMVTYSHESTLLVDPGEREDVQDAVARRGARLDPDQRV